MLQSFIQFVPKEKYVSTQQILYKSERLSNGSWQVTVSHVLNGYCWFVVTFQFQVLEKPPWSRRRVKLWCHQEWDWKAFIQRRSGTVVEEWALM